MQDVAEKQELRFIKSILKYTDKNSPAYMYGHALWIIMAGRGRADVIIGSPYEVRNLLKNTDRGRIIKEFIPGISSIDNWGDVDIIPALSALSESRLFHKTLEFWEDKRSHGDPAYRVLYKGELPESDISIRNSFIAELEKSKYALSTICEEFFIDINNINIESLRYSLDNICDKENSEVMDRYDELRGYVVRPNSERTGYDPLIHLKESITGTGRIHFVDNRYCTQNDIRYSDRNEIRFLNK